MKYRMARKFDGNLICDVAEGFADEKYTGKFCFGEDCKEIVVEVVCRLYKIGRPLALNISFCLIKIFKM